MNRNYVAAMEFQYENLCIDNEDKHVIKIERRYKIIKKLAVAVLLIDVIGILVLVFSQQYWYRSLQSPDLYVDSVHIDPLTLTSDSKLTAEWTIDFILENNNNWAIQHYEQVDLAVFYGGEKLSTATIPFFNQEANRSTLFEGVFKAKSVDISKEGRKSLAGEMDGGFVEFELQATIKLKLMSQPQWLWWFRHGRDYSGVLVDRFYVHNIIGGKYGWTY